MKRTQKEATYLVVTLAVLAMLMLVLLVAMLLLHPEARTVMLVTVGMLLLAMLAVAHRIGGRG